MSTLSVDDQFTNWWDHELPPEFYELSKFDIAAAAWHEAWKRCAAAHLRTHCGKGHKFTPENTYWFKGNRRCRACMVLREQQKRARMKIDPYWKGRMRKSKYDRPAIHD